MKRILLGVAILIVTLAVVLSMAGSSSAMPPYPWPPTATVQGPTGCWQRVCEDDLPCRWIPVPCPWNR